MATLAALVLAALIGGAVVLFSGSPAEPCPASRRFGCRRPSFRLRVFPTGALRRAGLLLGAPRPLRPQRRCRCSPTSDLSGSNLAVTPKNSALGFSFNITSPPTTPWRGCRRPRTRRTRRRAPCSCRPLVMLFSTGGPRFVLGPAEMTNTSVGSASAHRNQTGQWVVDYTMKSAGGSARPGSRRSRELPPAPRHRLRRHRGLGSDHPAQSVVVQQLRGTR